MPLDKKPDENKDEFVSRCISHEMGKGYPQDQSIAMCISQWDNFSTATQSVDLPPASVNFGKVKRIIFNEDFDIPSLLEYKNRGFSIHIKSKRKYQRSDRKTYNRLKSVGLTEDNLVFGELKDLNKRFDYDLMMTGHDPILEKLLLTGRDISKCRVISQTPVSNMEEANISLSKVKDVQMKFAKVSVVFTYEEKPGIPDVISKSRPFCSSLMSQSGKAWTLEEIQNLSTEHLSVMGLPEDVFKFRGGFYTNPNTNVTTPSCRHEWVSKVIVE